MQTGLGWQVADVTSQQHGRSGKSKGTMVGSAILTGGILAPAAVFALTSGRSKLVVTYTRDEKDIPELPVIPEGLGMWKKSMWFMKNKPEGIGTGEAYHEWVRLVTAHTKDQRKQFDEKSN